jgi:hypothetical protein
MPSAERSLIDNLVRELLEKENNTKFSYLLSICETYFGTYRTSGSHHVFKMPWPGDPRINLQKAGKLAKPYQVRQVVKCLKKLRS